MDNKIAYKTFKATPSNAFSEVMDKFFLHQLNLSGTIQVVSNLKSDSIDLSTLHSLWGVDGLSVIHNEVYEMNKTNQQEMFNEISNSIYLMLLTQSVENFERLLKKYVQILKEKYTPNKKNKIQLLLDHIIGKKSVRLGSNKDRIKFIKKNSKVVRGYFNNFKDGYKELYDLFLMVEQIRHLTVHEGGLLIQGHKIDTKKKYFSQYFDVRLIEQEEALWVTKDNAINLLDKISTLGYMIFTGLSQEFNLLVIEVATYFPPEEVLERGRQYLDRVQRERAKGIS